MDKVNANVTDLLAKVRENRTQHFEDYTTALSVWKQKVKDELVIRWEKIENTGEVDLDFRAFPKPVHYTSDYDTAIEMLLWETEATVELDQHTFKSLVLNQWAWDKQFRAATSVYLAD